jgi:hypothetical protein
MRQCAKVCFQLNGDTEWAEKRIPRKVIIVHTFICIHTIKHLEMYIHD